MLRSKKKSEIKPRVTLAAIVTFSGTPVGFGAAGLEAARRLGLPVDAKETTRNWLSVISNLAAGDSLQRMCSKFSVDQHGTRAIANAGKTEENAFVKKLIEAGGAVNRASVGPKGGVAMGNASRNFEVLSKLAPEVADKLVFRVLPTNDTTVVALTEELEDEVAKMRKLQHEKTHAAPPPAAAPPSPATVEPLPVKDRKKRRHIAESSDDDEEQPPPHLHVPKVSPQGSPRAARQPVAPAAAPAPAAPQRNCEELSVADAHADLQAALAELEASRSNLKAAKARVAAAEANVPEKVEAKRGALNRLKRKCEAQVAGALGAPPPAAAPPTPSPPPPPPLAANDGFELVFEEEEDE